MATRDAVLNVTARDDLPPISAPLTLYDRVIAHRKREWGSIMADATVKAAHQIDQKLGSSDHIALHLRYQQIGISAVAAAVRYQGSAKNQAYAPVAIEPEDGDAALT